MKKKIKNMQITKNFNIKEFDCKCGCDMPDEVKHNIVKLATQLQTLRDFIGEPITINSSYRCEEHNKRVGGVSNSQHLLGKAADIKIKGLEPKYIANVIEVLIADGDMLQGGLGVYNTFVHYDIRKTKARWDYR